MSGLNLGTTSVLGFLDCSLALIARQVSKAVVLADIYDGFGLKDDNGK